MSNTKVYCDSSSLLVLIEETRNVNGVDKLQISGELFFENKSYYLDSIEGSFDDTVKLFISYINIKEGKKIFGYDRFHDIEHGGDNFNNRFERLEWQYSKFELINDDEDDFYSLLNTNLQELLNRSKINLISSWNRYNDYVNFLEKVNSFSNRIT